MKLIEYGSDNRSTDVKLTSSGTGQKLAQRFSLKRSAPIGRARLYLKRVGSPTGYLYCVIYSDSSGLPDAAVTNGTSDAIPMADVGTTQGFINFDFDLDARPELDSATDYHVALEHSGYTYAAGTTEIMWGVDQSSPHFTRGEGEQYTGSAWADISTASDFCMQIFSGRRTADTYSMLSSVERTQRHQTDSGVFKYTATSSVSPTIVYDFDEEVAEEIDGWFAGAGFSTPVTNASAQKMIRGAANAGVEMGLELVERTSGFRAERGADTKTGAFRTRYYGLRDDLADGEEFVDALVALGMARTTTGNLSAGLSAGGILSADLDDQEDDTDLIQPMFKKSMWNNP